MSEGQETFEYGPPHRRATFVVVERKLPADYLRDGDRQSEFIMREYKIVAAVTARKLRGRRHYLFYEVAREGGGVWYSAAERV